MCVIFIAQKARPTVEMITAGWDANPHGGGMAWRENGRVRWEKNLKLPRMIELAATTPFPFIQHFRIPSCGGGLPELTHPFLIDENASCKQLVGSTKGQLLFHNGHYGDWKRELKEVCARYKIKLPKGPWSDTRAMAWMAFHYGIDILDLVEEKIVVFSPTELTLFHETRWDVVNGVICSNDSWKHRMPFRGASGGGGTNAYTSYHGSSPHSLGPKAVPANEEKRGGSPATDPFGRPIPISAGVPIIGETLIPSVCSLPPAPVDIKAIRKLRKAEIKNGPALVVEPDLPLLSAPEVIEHQIQIMEGTIIH